MRDRIRRHRIFGMLAAAECGGVSAGVRPQGAAVPVFSRLATVILSLVLILFVSSALAATPPGTIISNVANVTFTPGVGMPMTVSSPTVSVTTVVLRTPSVIEFLQYGPGAPGAQLVSIGSTSYSTSGTTAGPFAVLPPPMHITAGVGPAAIDLASPVPLLAATQYHIGEPVFIRLTDGDQNLDPAVRETVLVTIRNPATLDQEVLRLLETGPNAGVFAGYLQTGPAPAANGNGVLQVATGSRVTASYTDTADATDRRATGALVDPFGIVFDSMTGLPVNGAVVTIINAVTGLPATVYGDDGVSIFPSTVMSGSTATDSGGTVYTFSTGGYRFPFVVAPGTYRLVATPPAGYTAPSLVPTSVIQSLPGGPFAMVTPGSRGEDFIVDPGPALHIDIPVDPTGASLWLVKTAGKQTAAVGDFVPYHLSVENASTGNILAVTVTDRLPAGLRYRKGSARLNSAVIADPAVSPDGRSLTFAVGDLSAGSRASIFYVAEVGAGAPLGTATNTAVATGTPGALSNTARASVEIIEDLFGSTATIVGRVIVDGCGDKERSGEGGLAGIRIFREDGTFVVTDKEGRYHFAGVKPGTHVVQLDLATVPAKYEVMACEENTRSAGTPFSQFVDVQGGTLWRADFHVGLRPKQIGEIGIEITTARKCSAAGGLEPRVGRDFIEYTVPLRVGVVPARNIRVSIILPEGGSYRQGSAALAGRQIDAVPENGKLVSGPVESALQPVQIEEPNEIEGTVTFRFAEIPANWEGRLTFDAEVPVEGPEGKQLSTAALLIADSPEGKNNRTPAVNTSLVVGTRKELRTVLDIVLHPQFTSGSADLTAKDKQTLDRLIAHLREVGAEHIMVTGHTDSRRIIGKLRERYPDNYALSHERAASVGSYLAEELGLSPDHMTYDGKGPDEPVASNATQEGRARNRRVELRVRLPKQILTVPALLSGPASGMKAVATIGLRPGEELPQQKPVAAAPAVQSMPEYDAAWVATAAPGVEWLWPPEGHHPPIAAVKVVVKHDPARMPRLVLNGAAVDAIFYDGMTKKADGTVGVSRWSGVHLLEGDNQLELVLPDAQGKEVERLKRILHYSGAPVKAELVPERSRLTADGKETAVLAVRLLDRDGHAAREGTLGEFTVDPPYLAQQRASQLQQSPLNGPATDRISYQVGPNGIALIELAPTTQSGEAVVRLPLSVGQQEIRAWLKAESRDWILVGLAEGTYGYNVATGNMESMAGAGEDERYYDEGRVAFYAKGRIKGEWLLTMAYDSAKETPDGRPSLYQTVDPNKYYLLYGDTTEQLADAASAKKIYLKLEREQFYAIFGDYQTGLLVTELSKYSRNLTGLKSEMKGERFEYNVFLSETTQAFVKDEIRGDGTSGMYHLSRKNIVLNSDTIMIETRDRFRSEVIISRERLTRFIDYTIDYDTGDLWFKSPVYSRDENFNPIFIIAEYEAFDAADKSYTYGGRGAVKLFDNNVIVGATHVHEGQTGGEGNLTGVDATVSIAQDTVVRAEAAATKTEQAGTTTDGSAYLVEVHHRSDKGEARLYRREQDDGFGLGQQNGSETGTRKTGGDIIYRINTPAGIGAEMYRQETLFTGAVRDLVELRGRYTMPRYEAQLGVRRAADTLGTGQSLDSDQVFAGGRYQFTERLSGQLRHDQSLGSGESIDFPTRTTMGLDLKLNNTATLFANQEFTWSAAEDTATSRIGVKASPWTGGQLSSTVEQQTTEYGVRLFSTTGLRQSWQITKQWSVDTGLDRSSTIRHPGNPTMNPNVPPASGSTEDFTAVSLGAGYRQERWSWTSRVERRTAESENKFSTFMGANGEVSNGLALAAGLQTFRTVAVTGITKFSGDLRLGIVYRPVQTRLIVLDRLDLLREERKGGEFSYDNWRIINNYVMNVKPDPRTQLSFQYGAKFVTETIYQNDYRGYTDLTGLEGRYDLTKAWDIGLRGLMLHSWSIEQTSYGAGASVGYNAARNIWISMGYNVAGFTDRDFSRADFTAQGPFLKLRMKFDQVSVREAVRWITGQ